MAGELCELRDGDLCFSLAESGELLANFGVQVAAADLALLHERTEGWAAAVQIAALSLSGTQDPGRAARALGVRGDAFAEYFSDEVLEQQPPEVARFMLDTCVLGELTADACTAVTGRQDAAALLHSIDAANLFVVPLDEERTSFRYHHLVHQILRTRLRARDPARERAVQLRAGEWFESTGDVRRAARHFLATKQADRALALLQDRVFTSFQRDPALPPPPDLSMIDPKLLLDAPDRLLGLATDLLLSGDPVRGGEYLDLLERAEPPIPPDSGLAARLAEGRALRYMITGQAEEAVAEALAARAMRKRAQLQDEWSVAVPLILQTVYTWLEDYESAEREAEALAAAELIESARQVLVPGARAVAWLEAGHLAQAADAAAAAEAEAGRLGFGRHFSPCTTCVRWPAWPWSAATLTPPSTSPSRPCRYRNGGGPPFSSWRCWTGPGSGPLAGRSATRWPASRRRGWFWPGPDRRCWPAPMSWRGSCGYRWVICAPRPSWRAACLRPAGPSCWLRWRSPPATITPRSKISNRRRES